jgi:hypothetical protein
LLIWRCMSRRLLQPWSNGQERQARGIPAILSNAKPLL